jgi:fructose-1,6-bisphosphatase/inositol monophosphatase family enzyme
VIDSDQFLIEVRALVKQLAPQIVATWRATEKQQRTKKDGSLVTDTDHLVEAALVACMRRIAPDVQVIAEEEVSGRRQLASVTAEQYYGEFLQHEQLIVIDPIDGTKNFVEGRPYFCVAVGLTARRGVGHWPIAGVVAVPAQDVMFWSDGTQVVRESLTTGATEAVKRQGANSTTIFANSHEQRWLQERQMKLHGERCSYSASVYDILMTVLGENVAALLGSQRVWDLVAPLALALPLGLTICDAETGESVASLSAADFSQEIDKRSWRLTRTLVLLPPGGAVADVIVNCSEKQG